MRPRAILIPLERLMRNLVLTSLAGAASLALFFTTSGPAQTKSNAMTYAGKSGKQYVAGVVGGQVVVWTLP